VGRRDCETGVADSAEVVAVAVVAGQWEGLAEFGRGIAAWVGLVAEVESELGAAAALPRAEAHAAAAPMALALSAVPSFQLAVGPALGPGPVLESGQLQVGPAIDVGPGLAAGLGLALEIELAVETETPR
jgi:hypothetical protein